MHTNADDNFNAFLELMEICGIAQKSALVGCSDAEITALEHMYSIRLPYTYRRYLEIMGHNSGLLFRSDHMAVTYEYIIETTGWARACLKSKPAEERIELPTNALIIASRLGDQFEYILCDGTEDSAVWYYNDWENTITKTQPSVLSWLETWAAFTESAMKRGYFVQYSNGTKP